MQLPLDLQEDAEAVYFWDADADETVRLDQSTVPPDPTVPLPIWVSATPSGSDIDLSVTLPGELVDEGGGGGPIFVPSIDAVNVQYRHNQEPFWLPMSDLTTGGSGGTGTLPSVITGSSYDFGIRGVIDDRVSAWVIEYAVQVGFTLGAPTGVSATPGAGEIEVDATAPSDTASYAVQIWISTGTDKELAILVAEIVCDPSDPVTFTATGLPAGALHYVFVRAVTDAGAVGPWAATVTATPT